MNRTASLTFMGGSLASSYGRGMLMFHPTRFWFRSALVGALLAFGHAVPAPAQQSQGRAGQEGSFQVAQADCYAIGEQVAAREGGQLAKASSRNQGGRTVCVIVVLVPGRDGERPRRAEFVVPAD